MKKLLEILEDTDAAVVKDSLEKSLGPSWSVRSTQDGVVIYNKGAGGVGPQQAMLISFKATPGNEWLKSKVMKFLGIE